MGWGVGENPMHGLDPARASLTVCVDQVPWQAQASRLPRLRACHLPLRRALRRWPKLADDVTVVTPLP